MKLYSAIETVNGNTHVALWINSKVNFLVVENNGLQQAWINPDNATSVNFPIEKNDSLDIYIYRNNTDKIVGKMTVRYCGKYENKYCFHIIPDMTVKIDLDISGDMKMLQELPEYKFINNAGNAEYKIAFHNDNEDTTVVEGANTENVALNAALWGMSNNSPFQWASISHNGSTLHYIGDNNQWANEKPKMLLSVRDHNRLHIGFSCRNKIKTSIFDGDKLIEEQNHMYTLELKKGQKFIVAVEYAIDGKETACEVTLHYIEGTRFMAKNVYVDMTLYIERIGGLIDIVSSPNVKYMSMKKSVFMPLPDSTLEINRFHFAREIVFDSANDAFSFAISGDTVYQCFVPNTYKDDDGIQSSSQIFVLRTI